MAPLRDLLAATDLTKLIKQIGPDLVHAHTSKAGLVARISGAVTRIPVVYTAHTWSFAKGVSRLQRVIGTPIERLCAPLAAKIITVSEANRRLALDARVGHNQQLTTIWNGIPDTQWRAEPGRTPVRVVMVARFAAQKDQALLIRALSKVQAHFELVFVGSGPTIQAAKALAESLAPDKDVFFLGDRDDVAEVLSEAQIFALSTKWEGFPLSILEAMRAGLPVVASDVGGVREAVQEGVTGFVVPSGDEDQLRMRLEDLIVNSQLRARMGSNGRRKYEIHFSSSVMLSQTERVYHEVTNSVLTGEALWA
jgi:glycosyltransferase involved in cell wall biosynthesis